MDIKREKVSFCQLFVRFPLPEEDFGLLQKPDRSTIEESIKIFKDPSYKSQDQNINFLDSRDILLISKFFTFYGQEIANTDFFDCQKIDDKFCTCCIKDFTESDASLLSNLVRIIKDASSRIDTGCGPANTRLTFCLERDLKNIAVFVLKNSEQLKNLLKENGE